MISRVTGIAATALSPIPAQVKLPLFIKVQVVGLSPGTRSDKPLDRGSQMLTGVATYITGQELPCALTGTSLCPHNTPMRPRYTHEPFGPSTHGCTLDVIQPKTQHAKHSMLTLPRHQNTPRTPRRQTVQNQTC